MNKIDRVFHEHKCIFIHVPKTGGSSINKALRGGKYYQVDNQLPHDLVQHHSELWREYFTFAFVRNPWDRFISAFLYNTRRGTAKKQKARGIEKVLPGYNYNFNRFMQDYGNEKILRSFQFRPQTIWLWSLDNKPLDFDFIGRYERLQRDFDYVCEQIGLQKAELTINNASPGKKHYTEYYTDKTRRIIRDLYKTEIDYFGYEFGK